jgi:Redoxin
MFAFACASAGSFLRVSSRTVLSTSARTIPAVARSQRANFLASVAPSMSMTKLKVGDSVPSVTFKTRVRVPAMEAAGDENPFDWKDVTSEDYFKGKRVVLFALPGAFTPTCSSTHRALIVIQFLGVTILWVSVASRGFEIALTRLS